MTVSYIGPGNDGHVGANFKIEPQSAAGWHDYNCMAQL